MFQHIAYQIGKLAYPLFERFSFSAWNNAPRPDNPRGVTRGVGHDPDRVLLTGPAVIVARGTTDL